RPPRWPCCSSRRGGAWPRPRACAWAPGGQAETTGRACWKPRCPSPRSARRSTSRRDRRAPPGPRGGGGGGRPGGGGPPRVDRGGAVAHFVQARDLCPLAARTQLRLAAHRDGFARADARAAYVGRAERLLPSDPELFYLAGCLELADGERARAAASWRRSLA